MREQITFTATLVHTSGLERGLREAIELPLREARPPDVLHRPVNLSGSPLFEEWVLGSLDEWSHSRQALYKFTGHIPRDPNARLDHTSGTVLPWRR